MLIEETVYNGADNAIALALLWQGQTLTHGSAVTDDTIIHNHAHPVIIRCKIIVEPIVDDPADIGVIIDSNDHPQWFDFTDPLILAFKLGAAGIKNGRHVAHVHIFESSSPNGVVWADMLLIVKSISITPQI